MNFVEFPCSPHQQLSLYEFRKGLCTLEAVPIVRWSKHCFLDMTGLSHTWTHRGYDCLHKTCIRSSQQKSQHALGKDSGSPTLVEKLLTIKVYWGCRPWIDTYAPVNSTISMNIKAALIGIWVGREGGSRDKHIKLGGRSGGWWGIGQESEKRE